MSTRSQEVHEDRLHELRVENSARCAAYLRVHGSSTVAEVSTATGLSRPTVRERLRDLMARGLVIDSGRSQPGGQSSGRPASRYDFLANSGHIVGIDMSKHVDRLCVIDLSGRILDTVSHQADPELDAFQRAAQLSTFVEQRMSTISEPVGQRLAVSVAVPGALSMSGKLGPSSTFPEWSGVDVRAELARYFPGTLILDNDLNASCVAEHRMGVAGEVNDFIYFLLWHQSAAGLFLEGRVRGGAHHLAGELNQLTSTQSAEDARRWPSLPDFLATVDRAEAGDPEALESVTAFATKTAEQAAALLMSIDPEMLIVGGPLGNCDLVVAAFRKALAAAIHPSLTTPVVSCTNCHLAPVLGMSLMALDQIHRELFGPTAEVPEQLFPYPSEASPTLLAVG